MSAVDLPQSSEEKFETAIDTLRTAQEGDEVLFGNRKQPLTVMDTGGTPGEDRYIVVRGPKGGTYTIREEYSPDGSVPQFNTDNGQLNANNLRPAGDLDVGQRFPTDMLPNGGSDGSDDGEPGESAEREETPGVEAGETGTQDGDNGREHDWQSFDIDRGEGEWVVSGQHDTLGGKFTAVYRWNTEEAGWQLHMDSSTIGPNLDKSDRARLIQMIEDELEAEDESVIRTGGDIQAPEVPDISGSAGMGMQDLDEKPDFDVEVPGGEMQTGDEFVFENSGSPLANWDTLREAANVPEERLNDERFAFLEDVDLNETWTFVDELYAQGEAVPKSVNNWRLIDYGVITDDIIETQRKAARYNQATDELVGLVGSNGPESDENPTWYVYYVEDVETITASEREPVGFAKDVSKALDEVQRILHDNDEELDLLVTEDYATDEVTVIDAIQDLEISRRIIADAKNFDPFGIRSYINRTGAVGFIEDLDSMLVTLYETMNDTTDSMRVAYEDFSRGATMGPRERLRNFIRGLDFEELGQRTKVQIASSLSGVQRRFSGFSFAPVIDYDELGFEVGYYYQPEPDEADDNAGRRPVSFGLTLDPRARNKEGDVVTVTGDDDDPPRAIFDGLLTKVGLEYYFIANAANQLEVNELIFSVPGESDVALAQMSNRERVIGSGRTRTSGDGSQPVEGEDDFEEKVVDDDAPEEAANAVIPRNLRGERLDNVLQHIKNQHDDEDVYKKRQKYILSVAIVDEYLDDILDENGYDGWDDVPDDENDERKRGLARQAFGAEDIKNVYEVHGFSEDDFNDRAIQWMTNQAAKEDMTIADAVNDFISLPEEQTPGGIDESDKQSLEIVNAGQDDIIVIETREVDNQGETKGLLEDDEPDVSDDDSEEETDPGELSPEEQMRLRRIKDEIEGGFREYSDLSEEERELVSRANVKADVLDEEDFEKLQEIKDADEAAEKMMEGAEVDQAEELDRRQREETAGQNWNYDYDQT